MRPPHFRLDERLRRHVSLPGRPMGYAPAVRDKTSSPPRERCGIPWSFRRFSAAHYSTIPLSCPFGTPADTGGHAKKCGASSRLTSKTPSRSPEFLAPGGLMRRLPGGDGAGIRRSCDQGDPGLRRTNPAGRQKFFGAPRLFTSARRTPRGSSPEVRARSVGILPTGREN